MTEPANPDVQDPSKAASLLTEDGHLLVSEFGAFLGLHSERLQLGRKGHTVMEAPLIKLSHVMVLSGGVSISSNLIRECCVRGIPISFLDSRGEPYATLLSPELSGTVRTRREQLLAYGDERGLHLARSFARGKISNQVNLLRYSSKYRRDRDPELFERVRERWLTIEEIADELDRLDIRLRRVIVVSGEPGAEGRESKGGKG